MRIKVRLSLDSINDAKKKVEKYRRELDTNCKALVQHLVNEGLIKAQELVPVDTGVAQSSIIGYVDEDTGSGIIRAGGYCSFIEFRTGVVGLNSPHPSPEYLAAMQWAYASGKTIFTTKDGKTGWFYPTKDGGWRFTQGIPSRPFMYETVQYLKAEYKRIRNEVFK